MFNLNISNVFKSVLCGPSVSESAGGNLTKQIPGPYVQLLIFDYVK